MLDHFDPYYTWLGIPPEEQPADHYRLLGVRRFESNSEVLVNAADQRMAYLRTFQAGKRAVHSQKLLNEVSAAQVCLLDSAKKRAYDERLSRENAAKESAAQPTAVVPLALAKPVAQPLPRAQPIQPLVTTPIAPTTTFPRPEAPRPAPLFAQPLVTLSASAHPLQPVVKPKLALPASPVVLIAVSSAAALVLLVMGGLIWASWPRVRPEIVQEDKSEDGTVQQPTIVTPPDRPAVRPPSPPVEIVQPPITLVDVPSISAPVLPPAPTDRTGDEVTTTGGSTAGSVPLLDSASVKYVARFETGPGPMWARFTPDGKQVSFGSLGDSTGGTYATDGSGPGQLRIPTPVFALSMDGSTLAKAERSVQQRSDRIQVDRISSGGRSSPVAGSGVRLRGKANSLAISEDKRVLFAACGATEKLLALNILRNLEPIPAFRSNLTDVAWLDVRGDTLVCLDASGAGEVHSIRGRRIVQTLKVPAFPNSPAALLEPVPQKLSLLVFAPEQAVVQQLTGSKTLDRFPLPGLTTSANLLAISAAGDLVVLRDPAGIAIWNIAQNKAVTRIDLSHSVRFCAIHGQPFLLAFEAPDAQLFLCDLAKLLAQPRWILPSGAGWNAAYPTSRGSNTLSKSDSPPRPANEPTRNPAVPPMQTGANEAAGRAATAALRAKGFELSDDPATAYSVQASGLKLDAEVGRLLTQLPVIQVLSFESVTGVGEMLRSLGPLPTATGLRLYRSDVTDEDLAHLARLSALEHLDLIETKVTGAGLAHLKVLPNLKNLELPGGLTREAMAPLSQLTQLEHVNNWPSGITNDDLPLLGKLTNLRAVELNGTSVTGTGLLHLQSLRQLERLGLPYGLEPDDLVHVKPFNLKSFSFPQGAGDKELGYFAHMTNLQTLWTPLKMTDEGVKTLAKLRELKVLFLSGSANITGGGLAPLAALPKLQQLDLPQQIDDEGLRALSGSKAIRNLMFFHTRIRDPALVHLATMPSLESIGLPAGITDAGIVHLQTIPGLKDVRFYGSAITAQGIAKLKGCRKLESVKLIEVKLTDADITALSQLSSLKQLMIQQVKLSDEQRQRLKQSLPNCDISN